MNLVKKKVEDIVIFQQFIKSKRFLPSYEKLIDTVLSGVEFDPIKTEYFEYLKWRRFKNIRELLPRHIELIKNVSAGGLTSPLVIGRTVDGEYHENRLYDGDHRLIIARKIGIEDVICKVRQK